MKNLIKLIIAIVACELAGFVGSLFTTPAIPVWYQSLNKPSFTPPDFVFAPVWTILFALMGIAFYLVWKKPNDLSLRKQKNIAMIVFGGQLILNIFWSIIFFGIRSPGTALIEIVFLWFAILMTVFLFNKISRSAAWLLVPYLLWVSFATFLNYSIWILN